MNSPSAANRNENIMKIKDVPEGFAFEFQNGFGTIQAIKLSKQSKFNAINGTTWLPADLNENQEVKVLGKISVILDCDAEEVAAMLRHRARLRALFDLKAFKVNFPRCRNSWLSR